MPNPTPEMHDPRVLRALAHPARSRILEELGATGPMRAADVARELGMPANQASFHLRQLAKYGLVEEDPGAARDKRDRVWKLTAQSFSIELADVEKSPGGKAASAVFRRTKAAWGHVIVDRAYDDNRQPGTTRSVTEQAIRLTKEEALQLGAELEEVTERWAERTRGRDDTRHTYLLFQVLQPFPEDHPPGVDQ